MTSKGQVTIPAALRAKFGLKEGREFVVSVHNDMITFEPQANWESFFVGTRGFGKKARDMIAKKQKKALLTNNDIAEAAKEGRARGY